MSRVLLLVCGLAACGACFAHVATAENAQISRVSVDASGLRVAGSSADPFISDDGTLVAFDSTADLTHAGITVQSVYLRNTGAKTTTLISDGRDPAVLMGMSGDGNEIAYSDSTGIYVYLRSSGTATNAGVLPDGTFITDFDSVRYYGGSLSHNGRFLAFDHLVADPALGGYVGHVFIRDLAMSTTYEVPESSGANWQEWPTVSDDGRYVAFEPNLAFHPVEVIDRTTGNVVFDPGSLDAWYQSPRISPDGAKVLYQSDELINGNYIPHVYVGNIATGVTTDLTPAAGIYTRADGGFDATSRYVSFTSDSPLDPGDTDAVADVYLYDTQTGIYTWMSQAYAGAQPDQPSGQQFQATQGSAVSANGRVVAFESQATNLVPDDGASVPPTMPGGIGGQVLRTDIYVNTGLADTTPPTISCSPSATNAWYTANVTVSCTASDDGSGLANPTDTTFTLSTSESPGAETNAAMTSSRSVCDNAGNCATAGPFGPYEIDLSPPTIALARTSADAVSPLGAAASAFGPIASDGAYDPTPSVNCTPNPVAIGNQVLTCTATDQAGNTATATFHVHVKGAAEQASDLLAYVTSNHLGVGASLSATLRAVLNSLNANRGTAACVELTAFKLEVRVESGKKLASQQAAILLADANQIEAVVGCR